MAKRIQVALTESIASLGKEGDLVEVAPGYARNFLLPWKGNECNTSCSQTN